MKLYLISLQENNTLAIECDFWEVFKGALRITHNENIVRVFCVHGVVILPSGENYKISTRPDGARFKQITVFQIIEQRAIARMRRRTEMGGIDLRTDR